MILALGRREASTAVAATIYPTDIGSALLWILYIYYIQRQSLAEFEILKFQIFFLKEPKGIYGFRAIFSAYGLFLWLFITMKPKVRIYLIVILTTYSTISKYFVQ